MNNLPEGQLTVQADGSFVFVPTSGVSGRLEVPYTVVDPAGAVGTAVLSIGVASQVPVGGGALPWLALGLVASAAAALRKRRQ